MQYIHMQLLHIYTFYSATYKQIMPGQSAFAKWIDNMWQYRACAMDSVSGC